MTPDEARRRLPADLRRACLRAGLGKHEPRAGPCPCGFRGPPAPCACPGPAYRCPRCGAGWPGPTPHKDPPVILKNVIASAESIVAEIAIAEGYDPDLKKDLIDAVKKHGPELLQLAGKIVLAKLVPHL